MSLKIALLPGDGVGPEVTVEAVRVLQAVGDANGYGVDYGAPGLKAPPYSTTLRYYNGVTQQWLNEPVDFAEYFYANRPNRRLLTTYGGTWQGYLWQDRIIPTFGYRQDYNRTRDANSAISPTAATDGFFILPDSTKVLNLLQAASLGLLLVLNPLRYLRPPPPPPPGSLRK